MLDPISGKIFESDIYVQRVPGKPAPPQNRREIRIDQMTIETADELKKGARSINSVEPLMEFA